MKLKLLIITLFCSVVGFGQIVNITPVRTDFTGFGTSTTISPSMDFTGYTTATLDFEARTFGGGIATNNIITVSISTDGGSTWTILGTRTPTSSTLTAQTQFDLIAYIVQTDVKIRFQTLGASGTIGAGIDDIDIKGNKPPTVVPTITSNLNNLTTTYGTSFTSYTVTASNSPTSYSATGLPTGVTINTTTGVISGTATVVGTFPVSISATNIIGTSTVETKNYIVNPKNLTITGLSSSNKVYDGTTTATLGGTAALSGVIAGDVVTLSGTPVSNYASANVGTNYAITTTGYTISGAAAGKYTLSQPSVTNRNITAKPLTISGLTANNKVYDGNSTATLSGTAALVGVIGADVVTLGGTPTASFANATVGTAKTVTVSGYTIAGAQAANYSVTQPSGLTANITIATQTITFGPLADQMLSGTTFTLNATSTSGNPITYTSSNPSVATVSGNTVTMLTTGSTIFTASQAGTTNFSAAADVTQNQNIITGVAEIRVERATNANIPNGSAASNGFDTQFAMQTIGNSQTKNYNIRNIGGTTLNVSNITLVGLNAGDFSITAATPYSIAPPSGFVTFQVTFSPTGIGNRTATVSITSNDATKNPFTFDVQGTGNCPTTSVTATPASGPVATQVTITSTNPTTNNLTGATAAFGGVAATVLSSSASQMVVIIPAGAGNTLTTTNALGCTATLSYVVTKEDNTSCEGNGGNFTDLIISEVYDSNGFNVWHMELYNPTASTIDLATANYKLERYGDVGDLTPTRTVSLTGTVAPGAVFLINLGDSGTPCAKMYDFIEAGDGINANDQIKLTKNGVVVDVVNCPNETGYTIKRNLTATGPKTTFTAADWTNLSTESCTDLGLFPYVPKLSPIVNTQPVATLICTNTGLVLTVSASEGFAGGNPLAYQWFVVAPGVATWTSITNGGVYSGATTATLNISSFSGLNGYQYYCQVRENTATCFTATNAVIIDDTVTTTWNGTAWSNGVPTLSKLAIINGNYNTTTHGNIDACSITVNATFTATVTANGYFNIQNQLNNNGTVIIQNNGSLVQINDAAVNTGNITVERTATVRLQDYVYWSAPIRNQLLNTRFPTSPTGLMFQWATTATSANGGQGTWTNYTGAMNAATGYIVRAPNGTNATTAAAITTSFSGGVPHNGVFTKTISRGTDFTTLGSQGIPRTATDDNWNLIGNPYPSAISVNEFLNTNPAIEGFVKIWTHGQLPTSSISPFYEYYASNYYSGDYATVNSTGVTSGPGDYNIGTGQGFMVLMDAGAAGSANVTFNNSMRSKAFGNTDFYRNSNAGGDRSRIWLELASAQETNRILVGYVAGATQEKDDMYDAFTDYKPTQNFYSLVNNEPQIIQGRALPFVNTDLVPLGFKVATTGNFTIALATVDGLFANNGQTIYLEDKFTDIVHNLTATPYTFAATAGIENNRFVLRYTDKLLSTTAFELPSENVAIFASANEIKINTTTTDIAAYEVYNVLGQLLAADKNVKAKDCAIKNVAKNNQVLLVKATLSSGQIVTRKILF